MREWTDETTRVAATYFDTLPEREIRRRQDLCRQQQVIAYRAGNKSDAMADLKQMEDALAASMLRRTRRV